VTLIEKVNAVRVSTQREVLDFPKQSVITRDGAQLLLDAILNYRITSARTTLYTTTNLPRMLSKLLQAQVRSVAASLDVDQLIEGSSAIARLRGDMSVVASRWGVEVQDVRLQEVRAGSLSDALEQHKSADLANQGIMIAARSDRQTAILDGEAQRDRRVREAEGEAAQIRANARGEARAIVNKATAEAKSVSEIGRAVGARGAEMAQYLLALKYMDVLRGVSAMPNTNIYFLPSSSAIIQTVQALGLNTVIPRK
jgi:regulator of protease activity HflC (stomatin/prohibitin superfamily)